MGNGSWFDRLTPEDRTRAESKGWKADTDPSILFDSYKNLESLMGADKAGRTLVLPKDESDTAALDAIFSKLGKPDAPDKYEIPLPEGVDPTLANTFKDVFHKANLTTSQAKTVSEAYQALELDEAKKHQDFVKRDTDALKADWGAKFDGNLEVARAAQKAAGLAPEDVQALEGSIGPAKFLMVMEFFGRNYVDGSPPAQGGRDAPSFSQTTPAAAQAKIDQLRSDPNFMARMAHGDPKIREAAMMEMNELSKVAVNAKRT